MDNFTSLPELLNALCEQGHIYNDNVDDAFATLDELVNSLYSGVRDEPEDDLIANTLRSTSTSVFAECGMPYELIEEALGE